MNNRFKLLATPLGLLVQSVAFAVLGILFFAAPAFVIRFLHHILFAAALVSGVLSIGSYVLSPKQRLRTTLLRGLLSLAAALALLCFPRMLGAGLGMLVGIWALLNAVISLGFCVQLLLTRSAGWAWHLLVALVTLLFAALLVFRPFAGLPAATSVCGVYFVLYAAGSFSDFLREAFASDIGGGRVKRRLRIALPVLATAFIPKRLVTTVNDVLQPAAKPDARVSAARRPHRLEVFFHLGQQVAAGFGHVDICLDDTVYSYACYDQRSTRLFTLLSDGVFMHCEREAYIRYSTQVEKKTLMGFVMALTDEQAKAVRQKAGELLSACTPWEPRRDVKIPLSEDYTYLMQRETGCVYGKVTRGPYRKYNLLRTNCVALAELLVGAAGMDLLQGNGIVTPGSYLQYLDSQLALRHSAVIEKNVYPAGK